MERGESPLSIRPVFITFGHHQLEVWLIRNNLVNHWISPRPFRRPGFHFIWTSSDRAMGDFSFRLSFKFLENEAWNHECRSRSSLISPIQSGIHKFITYYWKSTSFFGFYKEFLTLENSNRKSRNLKFPISKPQSYYFPIEIPLNLFVQLEIDKFIIFLFEIRK